MMAIVIVVAATLFDQEGRGDRKIRRKDVEIKYMGNSNVRHYRMHPSLKDRDEN